MDNLNIDQQTTGIIHRKVLDSYLKRYENKFYVNNSYYLDNVAL